MDTSNTIIAILDHDEHQLFIEVVDTNVLSSSFAGSIPAYIIAKYGFSNTQEFSYEVLTKRVEVFGNSENLKINYN